MQFANRYLRAFGFGVKLGVLLLALLLPAVVWYLVVFELTPRVGRVAMFRTPAIYIVGLYATAATAKEERDRQPRSMVYEIKTTNDQHLFALTSGSVQEGDPSLKDVLERLWREYPGLVSNPPGLLENRVSDPALLLVRDPGATALGRMAQLAMSVLISVFCFALYFPLGGALVTLLRHGRLKDSGSLSNKTLEPSTPRRE